MENMLGGMANNPQQSQNLTMQDQGLPGGLGQPPGQPQVLPVQQVNQVDPASSRPPQARRLARPGSPWTGRVEALQLLIQTQRECERCAQAVALPVVIIPPEQRLEYDQNFAQLYGLALDAEHKLHLCAFYFREDLLRRFIFLVVMTHQAWSMLSSNPPRYILDLATVRLMIRHITAAYAILADYLQPAPSGPSSALENFQQQLPHLQTPPPTTSEPAIVAPLPRSAIPTLPSSHFAPHDP